MMKPRAAYQLEPTGAEMRDLVDRAMERIVRHVESLPDQPAHSLDGARDLARALVEPLPEDGTPYDELLDLLFDRAVPTSFNTAGPGYLAYIPGGGLFHAAVADLIADSVNRFVGIWLAAPGLAQLEANVVRWLCQIVGYPPTALGTLTSGGSLANLSAVVAARAARLPTAFQKGAIYASDQTHHSVPKALQLAGFPPENLRVISTDDRYRIRVEELEDRIAEDRRAGWQPFLVIGNGGTTNTGAVDDLEALARAAAQHGLWYHVDAAYGGFFALTARGRAALRGLEQADSITLDPHKGLFLPYGTGSLLVRDGAALRRAHSSEAVYLPAMQDEEDLIDFCQVSPELSRPFRGLRVWLPLKLFGARAFREALDEKLDLARWAARELHGTDGIEVVTDPELSIVTFRAVRPGLGRAETNALTRQLHDAVNARRRVFLTGTTVRGEYLIRICVLSFRTHADRMEQALEDIRLERAALHT